MQHDLHCVLFFAYNLKQSDHEPFARLPPLVVITGDVVGQNLGWVSTIAPQAMLSKVKVSEGRNGVGLLQDPRIRSRVHLIHKRCTQCTIHCNSYIVCRINIWEHLKR